MASGLKGGTYRFQWRKSFWYLSEEEEIMKEKIESAVLSSIESFEYAYFSKDFKIKKIVFFPNLIKLIFFLSSSETYATFIPLIWSTEGAWWQP